MSPGVRLSFERSIIPNKATAAPSNAEAAPTATDPAVATAVA